ncbi:MAG TPA: ATP-binding protein [Pseudomonadales bacterium]
MISVRIPSSGFRLLSNALAALTLVPLIVIGCQRGIRTLRRATVRERVEAVALLTGICTTSAVAFLSPADTIGLDILVHAPLPFLMWAAVRQGVGSVSLGASLMALFAIVGVVQGRGPFATTEYSAMAVQAFLLIIVSSLMLLAASLTELRLARRAALRQEESLNLALRAARMKAWDWDLRSDRMRWRPTSKGGVVGLDGSKSMGALFERIHPDDRGMVRRAIDAALDTGAEGEVELEYRIVDADRTVRWITSKGKITVDSRGRPTRMIGVHIDTTERKRHETEVRIHREQLTHLSRVSTLGELSGAIAHELNQPLTAILNNAQAAQWLLADSAPDLGDVAEILREIISEDRRAGEMIRTLRALFVRGAVQRDLVDINQSIRESLMIQHSDLVVRNVFVDTELGRDIPLVNGDRVELQQVLMNLIANACDAMADNAHGDRRLRIVSAANDAGGIDVEVTDNGHGIRDVAAIFEPFHTSKDGGIGLGLSICRTIITAHNGRIWATNNASRGATFHITIPAKPGESARFSASKSIDSDSRSASRGRKDGEARRP